MKYLCYLSYWQFFTFSFNFNTGCVTILTLWEVSGNYDIFKQASEKNPNEFHNNLHSKDFGIRFC